MEDRRRRAGADVERAVGVNRAKDLNAVGEHHIRHRGIVEAGKLGERFLGQLRPADYDGPSGVVIDPGDHAGIDPELPGGRAAPTREDRAGEAGDDGPAGVAHRDLELEDDEAGRRQDTEGAVEGVPGPLQSGVGRGSHLRVLRVVLAQQACVTREHDRPDSEGGKHHQEQERHEQRHSALVADSLRLHRILQDLRVFTSSDERLRSAASLIRTGCSPGRRPRTRSRCRRRPRCRRTGTAAADPSRGRS